MVFWFAAPAVYYGALAVAALLVSAGIIATSDDSNEENGSLHPERYVPLYPHPYPDTDPDDSSKEDDADKENTINPEGYDFISVEPTPPGEEYPDPDVPALVPVSDFGVYAEHHDMKKGMIFLIVLVTTLLSGMLYRRVSGEAL